MGPLAGRKLKAMNGVFSRRLVAAVWGVCAGLSCLGQSADLHWTLVSLGGNRFAIAATDGREETALLHAPPVTVVVEVDGVAQPLLDPLSGLPIALRLADEQPREAAFDELSLPTRASGKYALEVKALVGGEVDGRIAPLQLTARVTCSDPVRTTYMECFVNCKQWEITW